MIQCNTGGYIQIPDADALDPSLFSIGCWVRFNTLNITQRVFTKQTAIAPYGWSLYKLNTNEIIFTASISGIYEQFAFGSITDTNWHHIVGTYDGNNMRGYLDNVESVSSATPGVQDNRASDVLIGKSGALGAANPLNGDVTEAFVVGRAILTAEVEFLYLNKEKYNPSKLNDLVAYWPLDDLPDGSGGDGQLFLDYSGNQHNGFGYAGGVGITCKSEEFLTYPNQYLPTPIDLPVGAIINQLQGVNLGADLYNGTLL